MGLFFFHNWARNQLPLDINGAELIQKLISSQTVTGLFGNLRSQMLLESIANPKQWLVWWQRSCKGNQTPGSPCSSGEFSGHWMAPSHRRTLCVCEVCIPSTVMIMALFILGAFSFISSSVKMHLLDPFPRTGGNREHWTGRMGSKIFRKQNPGD